MISKPAGTPPAPRQAGPRLSLASPQVWITRRQPLAVKLLVLVLAVVSDGLSMVDIFTSSDWLGYGSGPLALYLLVADLAMWVVVALAPNWVWATFGIYLAPFPLLSNGFGIVPFSVLVALGLAAYSARRIALVAAVAVPAVWAVAYTLLRDLGPQFLSIYLPLLVVACAPGLVLRYLSAQRDLDAQTIARFEADAVQALQEQREELARELHDIVAHDITVIAMQARAGALTSGGGATAETFTVIADSARGALDDLRRLLRIMRESGAADEVAESPADIDLPCELTQIEESLAHSGVTARVDITGDTARIPDGVRSTVRRLLREGATNVLKHADVDEPVRLVLTVGEDSVEVEVDNAVPAGGPASSAPRFARSGFGIIGLRERVQLLGGSITAGPAPGGRWSLRASLPLRPDAPLST